MTLIKSISGIRGTIGGKIGDSLTPIDIVKFTAAYAAMLLEKKTDEDKCKVVVGRDARISGEMVNSIVCGTLLSCGIDVVNAGLASTPTVEMAVVFEKANGGIILTASHNPKQWNALKLLNDKGEFISADEGEKLLQIAESEAFPFSEVDEIGKIENKDFTTAHIKAVLDYPLVDVELIYRAGFKVSLDAVNSVGGIIMPKLFEALGINCEQIHCEPTGHFAHNPEPLAENLQDLSELVQTSQSHLGVSVDPDVDRLVIICEDGSPFGEEYTLVAVADYILSNKKGSTVSNLSSSRALRDITENHECDYYSSAVGEVNVSNIMKEVGAVIGGEGNGGIIVPDFHYGRDSLIGIALFLTHLAKKRMTTSELRATYPEYIISKNKIELSDPIQIDKILEDVKTEFASEKVITTDGVKIEFESTKSWIHLRKSNTEPIIRI